MPLVLAASVTYAQDVVPQILMEAKPSSVPAGTIDISGLVPGMSAKDVRAILFGD